MRKIKFSVCVGLLFLSIVLSSCITTQTHVAGKNSSLSAASKQIVFNINSLFDVTSSHIQISANNFWEKDTLLNLPFSSVLAEALASEFSKSGAILSVQDTGEKPLRAMGSYRVAGNDVWITVRLRCMGEAASTDLAVVEGRISRKNMDPRWLEPEFERISRSLVRLLELNYSGMMSLQIKTPPFQPVNPLQPELALGDELAKYMKDAFAASLVFRDAGDSPEQTNAVLKGDYSEMGHAMVFHVSILDKNTGRHLAGAKILTDIQSIPEQMLQPKIQSLDDLTQTVSQLIIEEAINKKKIINEAIGKNNRQDLTNPTNRVYIGRHNFHDAGLNAITPLGLRIFENLKSIFGKNRFFSVTDDPSAHADLILSGQYVQDHEAMVLSLDLNRLEKSSYGCRKTIIASAQAKMGLQFCRTTWFKANLKGHINFLMYRLENEAMAKRPCRNRTDVVINKFKLENKQRYSLFSDYLNDCFLDYFASSLYFSPVTHTQKIVTRSLTRRTRTIVATKNPEATIASVAKVSHFISGSFWPKDNGTIEIKTTLENIDGKILAAEQTIVKAADIDSDWLNPLEPEIILPPTAELFVELFTQKGRNNLSFRKGEEIIFFAKANKPVYIKIFTSDAQQQVFRIYPNEFAKKSLLFRAGEVTSIPGAQYAADFKFEVQGKTGNEQVVAFASDRPLPDLPGSKDAVYGMKQINLSINEIADWFTDYARKRGIALSWDLLPVLTKE
ncbi:DUF4384 domain-containing protein [Desulfobacula toluolica]|uniref:Uncharacterized protein related to S-layer proteins n=1 Tax=Desulfobacula toluolica (strain DSM 7467 / Tol2) TaxID=651182 RepID=K0NF34_DESTT|nr:DUF4384 domain-containing protein [Desulfobacula toluolica]CCK78258.1 uncharacterized protein related to S-layer proteins [Desulfobacula toluolica Tol2]